MTSPMLIISWSWISSLRDDGDRLRHVAQRRRRLGGGGDGRDLVAAGRGDGDRLAHARDLQDELGRRAAAEEAPVRRRSTSVKPSTCTRTAYWPSFTVSVNAPRRSVVADTVVGARRRGDDRARNRRVHRIDDGAVNEEIVRLGLRTGDARSRQNKQGQDDQGQDTAHATHSTSNLRLSLNFSLVSIYPTKLVGQVAWEG